MHSAITVYHNTDRLIRVPGEGPKEDEIGQFAGKFEGHQVPIPQHHFEHAFDEMKKMCLAKAREKGLIKA